MVSLGNKYTKTVKKRADGSFCNFIEVNIDKTKKIEFHKIAAKEGENKLLNISQLRILKAKERGIENPVVIVWDAFDNSKRADEFLIEEDAKDETIHISLNSFINFHLRNIIDSKNYIIIDKKIRVKEIKSIKDDISEVIIKLLEKENRIKIYMENENVSMEYIYENLDAIKHFTAVGNIGFPSVYCRKREYPLAFNTSFFLLEEDDYVSDFSVLGDTYGLIINDGDIKCPPIYNRYALLQSYENKWDMKRISLREFSINCFGKRFDLSKFSHNKESSHAIYTRYFGVLDKGQTINCSPINNENIDFIIIGCNIVGMKYYGGIEIPQNGFILSMPIKEYKALKHKHFNVKYDFLDNSQYKEAIQCGPGIIKDGEIILNESSLIDEEFYKKHYRQDGSFDKGVVPTDYSEDIDKSKHARIFMCVDDDNNIGLIAAESVNSGMDINGEESAGATLLEMAQIAKEKKYKFALNLDGGGSTNIQYLYGQLVRYADRRGMPGVLFERMIPCVGVIDN